jgi:hypothetical protein
MTLKPSIIIGVIVTTILTSGIVAAAPPVAASDINCDARPRPRILYCERGKDGIIYCGTSGAEDVVMILQI